MATLYQGLLVTLCWSSTTWKAWGLFMGAGGDLQIARPRVYKGEDWPVSF